MKRALLSASILFLSALCADVSTSTSTLPQDISVQKLIEGNMRYVNNASIRPPQDATRRKELLNSQAPFAVIVCCSDSRVPPEIIFDQGLGDIFVIRVAGNVVGPLELDSVEYAADILKSPLILVLGHASCGAVDAVIKGDSIPEDIENIAPLIMPAVERARTMKGDLLENATILNAKNTMKTLEQSPVLNALLKANKLKIACGYYELGTGKVRMID